MPHRVLPLKFIHTLDLQKFINYRLGIPAPNWFSWNFSSWGSAFINCHSLYLHIQVGEWKRIALWPLFLMNHRNIDFQFFNFSPVWMGMMVFQFFAWWPANHQKRFFLTDFPPLSWDNNARRDRLASSSLLIQIFRCSIYWILFWWSNCLGLLASVMENVLRVFQNDYFCPPYWKCEGRTSAWEPGAILGGKIKESVESNPETESRFFYFKNERTLYLLPSPSITVLLSLVV